MDESIELRIGRQVGARQSKRRNRGLFGLPLLCDEGALSLALIGRVFDTDFQSVRAGEQQCGRRSAAERLAR